MNTSSSLVARPEYWPLGMDHGRVILRSAIYLLILRGTGGLIQATTTSRFSKCQSSVSGAA